MNICLLGDSILDNGAYTGGQPAVVDHLNRMLGESGAGSESRRATLLAVDGSLTAEVAHQARALPPDATHFVVSSGGNDALQYQSLLQHSVASVGQAFWVFRDPLQKLEAEYRHVLEELQKTGLPGICCTIYNGWMDDPLAQTIVPIALSLFNDVIFRLALEYRIPVLDLRRICTAASDYANPIEPSGPGGEKIAAAIADSLAPRKDAP